MGVKINNQNVIALRIGNTPIVKRYIGGNVVYQTTHQEVTDYDILVTYDVVATLEATQLLYTTDNISKMYIDNQEIDVVNEYAFTEIGTYEVKYKLKDNTTIGINAFYGCKNLTSIEIQDNVTRIENYAFYSCTSLANINIPNSVTSIGNDAFSGCKNLASIEIPDSVTEIGEKVFQGCTSLTSIIIPNSVTSIGVRAFNGCSSLTSVTIGNSVTSIGNEAFYECKNLTSIVIPDSVTEIASRAFHGCSGLTSIDIPDSVTSIGLNAFYSCTSLASIEIGSGVTSIGTEAFRQCPLQSISIDNNNATYSDGGGYFIINKTTSTLQRAALSARNIPDGITAISSFAYEKNTLLTSINIPDSVTTIGERAFQNCSKVKSAIIGKGITSINNYAFRACSSLTSVTFNATIAPTVGNEVFNSITTSGTLYYPCGSDYSAWIAKLPSNWTSECIKGELEYDDYIVVRDWNGSLGYVVNQEFHQPYLDLGFTVVQSIIFYDAQDKAIESGNYDYYLQSVPDSTVYAKVNLKFHEGLGFDTNDKMVFAQALNGNLADVWEVHIDGYYEPVEDYDIVAGIVPTSYINPTKILDDTDDIEALYIDNRPIDITTEYLFDKLDYYELKIKLKPEVTKVPDSLFSKCDSLTTVIVGNYNLTEIGKFAFNECTSLTDVIIMESPFQLMHTIGKNAFDNCVSLTNVNIPQGVTTIDNNAFYYCKALTALTLPSSLTTIGYQAFSMSDKLANLTIPSGVTSIGGYAFKSCYGITSIAIPDSVTSLGEGAFYQCGAMTSVVIGSGISTIMPRTFEKCVNLTSIVFPENITLVSSLALGNCLKLQSVTCNAPSMMFASDTLYDVYATGSFYYPCSGDYTEALKYVPEAWTIECINDWQGGITPPEEEEPEEPKSLYDVTATVVVTSTTSTTALAKTISGMSAMYIDGVEIAPTSAYTFSTTGEHTVGYNFTSTSLASNIYSGCSTITEIVIGDRITSLNSGSSSLVVLQGTFGNMPSLEKVTIGNGITSLNATYGGFTTKSAVSAFGKCPSLIEINLGESITAITGPVFMGCEHLSSITIPASVQDMSDYVTSGTTGEYGVFQGCTSLKEVTFEGTTAPSIDVHTFPDGNAGIFYYPCGRDYSAVASKLSSWTDGCTGSLG